MSATVAQHIVDALADRGVGQVWGVVGDALNPLTDAIRTHDSLRWVGVRHEEAAAFAVSAQAQLTGRIGVCMGTVGPGSIHLLNGLGDAAKSHAPVLAIAGQVPTDEIGTNCSQEVDNDRLFAHVAVWTHTLTSTAQLPYQLERAVNAAYERGGVAVLTSPGGVGMLDMPDDAPTPLVCAAHRGAPSAVAPGGTGGRGARQRWQCDDPGGTECPSRPRRGAGGGRHSEGAGGGDSQGQDGHGGRQSLPSGSGRTAR